MLMDHILFEWNSRRTLRELVVWWCYRRAHCFLEVKRIVKLSHGTRCRTIRKSQKLKWAKTQREGNELSRLFTLYFSTRSSYLWLSPVYFTTFSFLRILAVFEPYILSDQEGTMATFMWEQRGIISLRARYSDDLIKLYLVTEGNCGDLQLIQVWYERLHREFSTKNHNFLLCLIYSFAEDELFATAGHDKNIALWRRHKLIWSTTVSILLIFYLFLWHT